MQKWEIKKLFVPLETQVVPEINSQVYMVPNWNGVDTKKAFEEADALGAEGWELVGFSQLISGHEQYSAGNQSSWGKGCSYTNGYLFVFKRPID